MNTEVFETFKKLNQETNDSVRSLCDINANAASQLVEQQLALFGLVSDFNVKQMEMIAGTRNYKELANAESSAMKEFSESAQALIRGTLDIFTESRQEMTDWLNKGFEKANSAVSSITPKATGSSKKSS